jgi:hypothetical protein
MPQPPETNEDPHPTPQPPANQTPPPRLFGAEDWEPTPDQPDSHDD